MDELLSKRQLFQSVGQLVIVVITGLLVYEDFAAVAAKGWANALWLPGLQGILAALGILGISKVGPK